MKHRSVNTSSASSIALFIGIALGIVGVVTYINRPTQQAAVLGTSADTTTVAQAREFFVPLGFAIASAGNDWTDIPGMQVSVNSSLYPKIKQVTLETTVYVPTGNQTVWVRLRNSDYYSSANSEVTMDGMGPKLLTSSPFSISPGAKTYTLQLKTQLNYPVHIYQARLHIIAY